MGILTKNIITESSDPLRTEFLALQKEHKDKMEKFEEERKKLRKIVDSAEESKAKAEVRHNPEELARLEEHIKKYKDALVSLHEDVLKTDKELKDRRDNLRARYNNANKK